MGYSAGHGTIIYEPTKSNFGRNVEIGKNCKIHWPVWIGDNVVIGDNVKIQAFTFIPEGVTIEDDVFIGPQVGFANDPKLSVQGKEHWAKTLVKKGAKIGLGAKINAGVTIGENAIVGMGAIVIKDVEPNTTVVGNPAKVIDTK